MDMKSERRKDDNDALRRLIVVGGMMAAKLDLYADSLLLDQGAIERRLVKQWERELEALRATRHAGRTAPVPREAAP